MKLGKTNFDADTEKMSDQYLQMKYDELISDQLVANAVMAVLLKLEIERRRTERLLAEANYHEILANQE